MKKLITALSSFALVMLAAAVTFAAPGKPDFGPHVYADGVAWGTKVTTELPPPKGKNHHSFDAFYVVVANGQPVQLPVGEAGPRNKDYNGGRWVTYTAVWNAAGMAAHNPLPVLKSDEEIMVHYNLGHIDLIFSPPADGPPAYFQCPLLPVKE